MSSRGSRGISSHSTRSYSSPSRTTRPAQQQPQVHQISTRTSWGEIGRQAAGSAVGIGAGLTLGHVGSRAADRLFFGDDGRGVPMHAGQSASQHGGGQYGGSPYGGYSGASGGAASFSQPSLGFGGTQTYGSLDDALRSVQQFGMAPGQSVTLRNTGFGYQVTR